MEGHFNHVDEEGIAKTGTYVMWCDEWKSELNFIRL
jgi:hypothetical protein